MALIFQQKKNCLLIIADIEQIKKFLEVDSIGYISLEGMLDCAIKAAEEYCTACWSGSYRIPVDMSVSKYSLEIINLNMFDEFVT